MLIAVAASAAQVLTESEAGFREDGQRLRFIVAEREFVAAFDAVGGHARELRRAMIALDAEAFDAVILDLMGALIALPYFRLGDGDPGLVRPRRPRPDRIPRIEPDLRGLDRFFERLSRTASSEADSRMFTRARKDAQRMLAGLATVLPPVSAKPAATGKGPS